MTNLEYPFWQKPYQEALMEFDPRKLTEKISAAESAIFLRFQSLSEGGERSGERLALNDALRALRVLQGEKLH